MTFASVKRSALLSLPVILIFLFSLKDSNAAFWLDTSNGLTVLSTLLLLGLFVALLILLLGVIIPFVFTPLIHFIISVTPDEELEQPRYLGLKVIRTLFEITDWKERY